jgi:hypothetical protein
VLDGCPCCPCIDHGHLCPCRRMTSAGAALRARMRAWPMDSQPWLQPAANVVCLLCYRGTGGCRRRPCHGSRPAPQHNNGLGEEIIPSAAAELPEFAPPPSLDGTGAPGGTGHRWPPLSFDSCRSVRGARPGPREQRLSQLSRRCARLRARLKRRQRRCRATRLTRPRPAGYNSGGIRKRLTLSTVAARWRAAQLRVSRRSRSWS